MPDNWQDQLMQLATRADAALVADLPYLTMEQMAGLYRYLLRLYGGVAS